MTGRLRGISTWVGDNGFLTVLFIVLTTIGGIVLSEVQNRIGWQPLLVALGFVLMIYWLTLFSIGRPILNTLAQLKADLSHELYRGTHDWLFDTRRLVAYERNVIADEIWLITSDLLDDSQGGPFFEVVKENLDRDIVYYYFFPDTPENRSRQATLSGLHRGNKNLKFVSLSENFFMLVPKLDIAIYNPFGNKTGFLGIPAVIIEESNHYHASVGVDLIDMVVGTLLPHRNRVAGSM